MNLKLRKKLYPSDKKESKKVDTVKRYDGIYRNDEVLMNSFNAWNALQSVRDEAELNEMYVFGDQWGEKICYKGKYMTERDSIRLQGHIPMTNNRMRSIVRSVSGVFQSNQTEPICVARERDGQERGEIMTSTLQAVYQNNKTWDLDIDAITNLIISGITGFKTSYGWRKGKMDVWTDPVNHNRIFFDPNIEDMRMWDCSLIGEIEDMSIYDVMARFADGDKDKASKIKSLYSYVNPESVMAYADSYVDNKRIFSNFFLPENDGQCRVITTWRKESKERVLVHDTLNGETFKIELDEEWKVDEINKQRINEQLSAGVELDDVRLLKKEWFVDRYWYYYHQTPLGHVIKEGESPFWHGEHPYSFKMYKFYNKRIYPFISGFRDQQRYINRLITLQDFMMRASAKGVLMVPKQAIEGSGLTPEQFAEQWVQFNGVIVYEAKPGMPIPQQITANSTNLGVYDMLSVQLKMIEDASGVQGSLQGQTPSSGTPAALYAQQTQNASTSLMEIFSILRMLREERDVKTLKTIQQYYDAPKYINVSGNVKDRIIYDPKQVRNLEFDLSIVESTSTPAFRLVINDMLMNLLNGQHITIKEMLENGSFPFADKLLQSIKSREAQMGEMAATGNIDPNALQSIPPEIMNSVNNQANPQAVNMLNMALSNNNVA